MATVTGYLIVRSNLAIPNDVSPSRELTATVGGTVGVPFTADGYPQWLIKGIGYDLTGTCKAMTAIKYNPPPHNPLHPQDSLYTLGYRLLEVQYDNAPGGDVPGIYVTYSGATIHGPELPARIDIVSEISASTIVSLGS